MKYVPCEDLLWFKTCEQLPLSWNLCLLLFQCGNNTACGFKKGWWGSDLGSGTADSWVDGVVTTNNTVVTTGVSFMSLLMHKNNSTSCLLIQEWEF